MCIKKVPVSLWDDWPYSELRAILNSCINGLKNDKYCLVCSVRLRRATNMLTVLNLYNSAAQTLCATACPMLCVLSAGLASWRCRILRWLLDFSKIFVPLRVRIVLLSVCLYNPQYVPQTVSKRWMLLPTAKHRVIVTVAARSCCSHSVQGMIILK